MIELAVPKRASSTCIPSVGTETSRRPVPYAVVWAPRTSDPDSLA